MLTFYITTVKNNKQYNCPQYGYIIFKIMFAIVGWNLCSVNDRYANLETTSHSFHIFRKCKMFSMFQVPQENSVIDRDQLNNSIVKHLLLIYIKKIHFC